MSLQEKTNAKSKALTKGKSAPLTFIGKRTDEINSLLGRYESQVKQVIGKHVTADKIFGVCSTIVAKNPEIAKCNVGSFVSAMITTSMLDLDPTPELGQVYFVPFGGQVQFIIGYRGLLNLVRRSGEIESVTCECIYENDTFDYQLGLRTDLKHIPAWGKDRGKLIGAYAVLHYKHGGYDMKVMASEDILKHKAKSKAGNSKFSPWNDDLGVSAMYCKTVLKQICKLAPISIKDIRKTAPIDGAFLKPDVINPATKEINYNHASHELDPTQEIKQPQPEPEKTPPPKKKDKKKAPPKNDPIVNKETGEIIDASEFENTNLNDSEDTFKAFKTFNDIWIVKTDFFRNTAYTNKRAGFNIGEYIKKNALTNKDGNEASIFTDLKPEDQVRILFQLSR